MEEPTDPKPTFNELNLKPEVLAALEKNGYKHPTEVQKEAIPPILQGHDVIALAKTGSGKTAACAIPVSNEVNIELAHVQALVIVPTRELALQYAVEAQKIGSVRGVKTFAMYGGEDASIQRAKLVNGVHVLVSTPGRLIDFIYSRDVDLSHVKILILDEADEMLSMGFIDDLDFIMGCLVNKHQTCLFSATMPAPIKKIAERFMVSPVTIKPSADNETPSKIDKHFVYLEHGDRDDKMVELLKSMNPKQAMIFCHSRIQVEKVCQALKRKLDQVDYLHAGLTQDVRTIITNKFRSGKVKYLVATDVAARGLDFSNVTHVFIYELSDDPDVFIHRSGRTGRIGREGTVVTFVTKRELWILRKILAQLNEEPQWIGEPPPAGHHGTGHKHPRKHFRKR
jgi:ATP-dependent RNA helicase DeaD